MRKEPCRRFAPLGRLKKAASQTREPLLWALSSWRLSLLALACLQPCPCSARPGARAHSEPASPLLGHAPGKRVYRIPCANDQSLLLAAVGAFPLGHPLKGWPMPVSPWPWRVAVYGVVWIELGGASWGVYTCEYKAPRTETALEREGGSRRPETAHHILM